MNAILNKIIEARNGHYCHALEVATVYEIECTVEQIYSEFIGEHDEKVIIGFFESMQVYSLSEDETETEEIYNFNFSEFITNNLI
jgi:hypothetical protein